MRFGICIPVAQASAAAAAGWDYVEDNAQGLLRGTAADADWAAPAKGAVPVVAVNVLVPGAMRVTGADVDAGQLSAYMATVARRAAAVGVETVVFGSGTARAVPAGFDFDRAHEQVVAFAMMAADALAAHGIGLAIEPLNKGECNIVNTLAEAAAVADAVARPNCFPLLDTWHLWMERGTAADVAPFAARVRHVHVADLEGRVAPGASGKADYRPVFAVLKAAGYDRTISVESAPIVDFEKAAPAVLAFLKDQWAAA